MSLFSHRQEGVRPHQRLHQSRQGRRQHQDRGRRKVRRQVRFHLFQPVLTSFKTGFHQFKNLFFSVGFFIEPTVVETSTPSDKIFREEIFGPVVTVFVYDDNDAVKTLDNVINGNVPAVGPIFCTRR
jgi:acyl-CoA reductase-like NAD-dependent aldehyde dehydrogenase